MTRPVKTKHTTATAKTLRDWLVAHGYKQADANKLVKAGDDYGATAAALASDLKGRPKK